MGEPAILEIQSSMLNAVQKCLEELVCSYCKQKLREPVRIKVCGHYYCKVCLNVNTKRCPLCKNFFEIEEVDSAPIANECSTLMEELKQLLLKNDIAPAFPDAASRTSNVADKNEKDIILNNSFSYMGCTYKLNFIDSQDKVNAKGESQLHIFAKKKNITKVLELINNNTDINVKDFAGWAPLHEAIEAKSSAIAVALIDGGAIVNIPGEKYITPLHKAVENRDIPLIKKLISHGADVNAIDYAGYKPVDYTRDSQVITTLEEHTHKMETIVYNVYIKKKMVAYCHSIDSTYYNKLLMVKNKLTVRKEFSIRDQHLTHLLVKRTHQPSLKILLSMVAGLLIIPQEWIDDLLDGNYFLPLHNQTQIVYNEILNKGIKNAIINKLAGKPKLFDGINFYIEGHEKDVSVYNMLISKNFLRTLVKAGGGECLLRAPAPRTVSSLVTYPYHLSRTLELQCCSNFIIFDEKNPPELQYNMRELRHKSSKWLVDCVLAFHMEP